MAAPSFVCAECGASFSVKPEVLARYPGWKPAKCWPCKSRGSRPAAGGSKPSGRAAGRRRTGRPRDAVQRDAVQRDADQRDAVQRDADRRDAAQRVLERHHEGPKSGVFTDGACSGNPGPGGWGVVIVDDDEIVDERHGHEAQTTNNRMELTALIAAYEMLPEDAEVTIWSDSNLCVQTLNQWAAGWERRGWKRKGGPVKNLDLVRRAYQLARAHPKVELRWLKGHAGSRWNEYADALATSFERQDA